MKNIDGIWFQESETMWSRIVKPEHFMRMFQGFGISITRLNKLKDNLARILKFIYEGKNGVIIYHCDIEKFMYSNKKFTFGDEDEQVFVRIKDMKVIDNVPDKKQS